MSVFRDFFAVKQKPVFTGSRFGFGSSSATGPTAPVVGDFFEFQVWGGGGGSGGSANDPGGGGAYVSVKYNISKGTTLKFIVGSGGRYSPRGVADVAYGGGGAVGPLNYPSSTGAGCSGIFITPANIYSDADSPAADRVTDSPSGPSSVVQPGFSAANALIIAAGGGGAAYDGGGGGGGITAGGDGQPTPDSGAYGRGGTWGGAGTDTGAGGSGGPESPGRDGFLGAGGESTGGGGGGGGFYGGQAGTNGSTVASGGGGSSYYWTTQSKPPAFVSYQPGSIDTADGNPGFTASNKGQVGGGAAPNNPGVYGRGNGPNSNGGDGRIAYRKHDSYSQLPQAEWVILDYTGSTQTLVV